MFTSYFLFGNYCCLDILHSPPSIGKITPWHKKTRQTRRGNNARYIPPPNLVPEVAVHISPYRVYLKCVHVTSWAAKHIVELCHSTTKATHPHGSFGVCNSSLLRDPYGVLCTFLITWAWHCGYRRLVFKFQVLKSSRPSSIISIWLSDFFCNFNSIFFQLPLRTILTCITQ